MSRYQQAFHEQQDQYRRMWRDLGVSNTGPLIAWMWGGGWWNHLLAQAAARGRLATAARRI